MLLVVQLMLLIYTVIIVSMYCIVGSSLFNTETNINLIKKLTEI